VGFWPYIRFEQKKPRRRDIFLCPAPLHSAHCCTPRTSTSPHPNTCTRTPPTRAHETLNKVGGVKELWVRESESSAYAALRYMIFIRLFLRPCVCSYIQVVSPGLDGVCAFILLMCHICCIVAYTFLSSFQAMGGAWLLHLLKGQFVSFVIAAEHNSYLRPTCTTSL